MTFLERKLIVLYLASLFIFIVCSWFPTHRLWAFNFGGYLPVWYRWVSSGIALLPPLIWYLLKGKLQNFTNDNDTDSSTFNKISIVTILGFTGLFFFFSLKTYFLGDGYTVLSLLASENPLIKNREIGEALIHIWVKNIFGTGENSALLSFQSISIVSGFLFSLTTIYFTKRLFNKNIERVIFLFGINSGGYMLLYFGYVENYSIFVLSVLILTLTGLLIATDKIKVWYIIPALLFSIFMHIMGVTLIPAAIYLLVSKSGMSNSIKRLKQPIKYSIIIFAVMIFGSILYYIYNNNYFFKFSVIPIFANRFTIEGYTLFSYNHLLDMLNLLFMQVPAFLILVIVIMHKFRRSIAKGAQYRFLLILILSTSGAAFIFDPKLGMPRDWDLFAFAGLPIVIFSMYLILSSKIPDRTKILILFLILSLGALSITSRITIHNNDDSAIARFQYFCKLDKTKGRPGGRVLIDYYRNNGRENEAILENKKWNDRYPQTQLAIEGRALVRKGLLNEAVAKLTKAVEIEPTFYAAWANLVSAYIKLQRYPEALRCGKIAAGLNPLEIRNFNNLGTTSLYLGNYKESEKYFLKVLSIDENAPYVLRNLLNLYKQTKQYDKYLKILEKLVAIGEAPVDLIKLYGDFLIKSKKYDSASVIFEKALQKGLDTQTIINLIKQHPELHFPDLE